MQRMVATMRMCIKENSYFGFAELFGQYFMRGINLLAMLLIWRTLFAQGADLDGLTLQQMLLYTVLSTVLQPLLNIKTPASSWLHEGTMLSLFTRPASLFAQLIAHTIGGWVIQLAFFSLPVLILAGLAGLHIVPASGWFFLSLPLSIAQGFAMDFLFTCLMIRMRNMEWTMHYIRSAMNVLFTGAVIPFAALPWGLGRWLSLSPFGMLAGAPLALYSGLDTAARLIPAQLLWTALLWPLAIWGFARSRERMVSFGG